MSTHWILDDEQRAAVAHRVLLDAWLDGSRLYWQRRARQLEDARPRRGDFTGRATPDQLTACWDRLTEAAAACRARASLDDVARTEANEALSDLGGAA